MKKEIPFDKKTEIIEFGKFLSELVRQGLIFDVEFTNEKFIVVLTGGY
jgi:hypothetical protein